jgi:hypothetical protein
MKGSCLSALIVLLGGNHHIHAVRIQVDRLLGLGQGNNYLVPCVFIRHGKGIVGAFH